MRTRRSSLAWKTEAAKGGTHKGSLSSHLEATRCDLDMIFQWFIVGSPSEVLLFLAGERIFSHTKGRQLLRWALRAWHPPVSLLCLVITFLQCPRGWKIALKIQLLIWAYMQHINISNTNSTTHNVSDDVTMCSSIKSQLPVSECHTTRIQERSMFVGKGRCYDRAKMLRLRHTRAYLNTVEVQTNQTPGRKNHATSDINQKRRHPDGDVWGLGLRLNLGRSGVPTWSSIVACLYVYRITSYHIISCIMHCSNTRAWYAKMHLMFIIWDIH